jgi:hypothetical protein
VRVFKDIALSWRCISLVSNKRSESCYIFLLTKNFCSSACGLKFDQATKKRRCEEDYHNPESYSDGTVGANRPHSFTCLCCNPSKRAKTASTALEDRNMELRNMRWLLEDSTEPPIIPTTESRVYEDAGTCINYHLEAKIHSRGSTDLEQVYASAAPAPSPPPVVTKSLSRTRIT